MKIDLSNKIALVTGASGGLGRTIVRTLAECGADVIIHYHSDETTAKKLVDEITSEYKVRAISIKADITKNEDIIKMKESLENGFGLPDLLVPNAVIQYNFSKFEDEKIEYYYSQFESCVMQMVYLCKAFLPNMKEKHYGKIVAINTECSYMAEPRFSAYVAAKRGLDGVVRVLAKEVGPFGITINEVAPGWTITDKERDRTVGEEEAKEHEEYIETVPLRRRGNDQDIANMVAFFLSDLAGFTTGAYIPVSGGRVMPAI